MARKSHTQMPVPSDSGLLRKVVGAAVAVTIVVIVVKHPADAASAATSAAGFVGGVIDGLWSFVRQLG